MITEITLENFQSIKDRFTVPIKPLTILVGPNSAGKSSIFDALEIFELLLLTKKENDIKLNSLIRNSARLETNINGLPDKFYDRRQFSLGVKIQIDNSSAEEDWESAKNTPINCFLLPVGSNTFEIIIDIDSGYRNRLKSFIIKFNNQILIKLESEIFKEEGQHPRIRSKKLTIFRLNFFDINTSDFEDDEFTSEFDEVLIDDKKIILNLYEEQEFGDNVTPRNYLTFDSRWFTLRTSLNVVHLFQSLLAFTEQNIEGSLLSFLPKVDASRTIPSASENLYFITSDYILNNYVGIYKDRPYYEIDSLFFEVEKKFNKNINDHWHWLAQVFGGKKLFEMTEHYEDGDEKKYSGALIDLADKINKYISNELFNNIGYIIDTDVLMLIPNELDYSWLTHNVPAIVKLYLLDANRVRHEFNDVGSGIGYIIPAICSIVSPRICKIQQPELHLHPALQAPIADICLENCNNNRNIILETHSEHLILRLLRLIRNNKNVSNNIKPENVSVLYFEPQINNISTRIKSLRISEDGSFIDEWPNGFFIDRYKDIFDE